MIDMPPFLIDAAMLTEFQACRRRFLYTRYWRPRRWIPRLLFNACLRQGILDIGDGKLAEEVIAAATTRFFSVAAEPGLDVIGLDPYRLACDYAGILETVLYTLSRRPITKLAPLPSRKVGDHLEFLFLAHVDKQGELHRTVTVDRFSEDALTKEMHSWFVFAETAIAQKPMHLQFIAIGSKRDGRQHTPWIKAQEHEHIAHRIKFQRKGGKALQGDAWRDVWMPDSTVWNYKTWCDAMAAEGLPDQLIHEVVIEPPTKERIIECKRHVQIEAEQMQQWIVSVANPSAVPMARAACHFPNDCAFIPCCYSPLIDIDPSALGLYKRR